jgi:hypothetical protein
MATIPWCGCRLEYAKASPKRQVPEAVPDSPGDARGAMRGLIRNKRKRSFTALWSDGSCPRWEHYRGLKRRTAYRRSRTGVSAAKIGRVLAGRAIKTSGTNSNRPSAPS